VHTVTQSITIYYIDIIYSGLVKVSEAVMTARDTWNCVRDSTVQNPVHCTIGVVWG